MIESSSSWFDLVPKAELHVHLEGAIPLEALHELVRKYGGDELLPDVEALRRKMVYRDFPHFLETWSWKNGFLREYDDFRWIGEAVARSFAAQNIRYSEAFFSPSDFFGCGLETGRIAEAIRGGLARVPEVEVALVADLVRDHGPERGARTLREAHEARTLGIVGIGIGGSEHAFPPEPFAPVFEEARRLGFRTTVHAGEGAGPESVWGALRALRPDRVGHAVRAAEDPALLDHLARSGIPLEMCPLSNVRSGIVRSLAEHPIRRFLDEGATVTVNTDDPAMFGTSLATEFAELERVHGLDPAEVRGLLLRAIDASWLPGDRKERLAAEFVADPHW